MRTELERKWDAAGQKVGERWRAGDIRGWFKAVMAANKLRRAVAAERRRMR